MVMAGAPPPTRTIERVEVELGWEFIQIYGLTESSPLLTMSRSRSEWDDLTPRERAVKLGRAGAPALGVDLHAIPIAVVDAVYDTVGLLELVPLHHLGLPVLSLHAAHEGVMDGERPLHVCLVHLWLAHLSQYSRFPMASMFSNWWSSWSIGRKYR